MRRLLDEEGDVVRPWMLVRFGQVFDDLNAINVSQQYHLDQLAAQVRDIQDELRTLRMGPTPPSHEQLTLGGRRD